MTEKATNPITGLSPRPEQASNKPVWWQPHPTPDFPIAASRFESKCGYCQGICHDFVLSCPSYPTLLQLPIKDQVVTNSGMPWMGSFLAKDFADIPRAFAYFQEHFEPQLHFVCCNWRGRQQNKINLNVAAPSEPPDVKALNLRWYLFYGATDDAVANVPLLGLPGTHFASLKFEVEVASQAATGDRHYPFESLGLYFGPPSFDPKEPIEARIEGWCLVLLHKFTDQYLDPISLLPIDYPRWALVSAYIVKEEKRFQCRQPTTWSLAYNPCNQPDHEVITTPFLP